MPINFPFLKLFQFESVSVDRQGKIIQRKTQKAEYFSEDLGNGVNLDLVAIPGGKFLMGTEEEEIERLCNKFNSDWLRKEKPQHEVTIKPFFMGKCPITQAQWRAIANLPLVNRYLKSNPSRFKGDNRPVENVSWKDAVELCQRLSRETTREYRLPSEAEWEYAIRAETTTPFHFGPTIITDLANYNGSRTYENEPIGKYRGETTAVGSFAPNAFGLYDLHGNVWEWCADHWHPNYEGAPTDGSAWWDNNENQYRLLRGGSWFNLAQNCRCAYRTGNTSDFRYYLFGVRVVCIAPRSTKKSNSQVNGNGRYR